MKLQALRVRGVGPFALGAAVEGLSGGLDVLIGPNEAGKSTLFRALETVFFKPYSTGGAQFLDALASGAGRLPLIEADFDVAGARWRITKQYSLKVGKSRHAQLIALDGSTSCLHDEAAEDKLAQLIGLGGGKSGRLGFLWVGQGEGLQPWQPKDKDSIGQQATLKAVLEREVAAVAGLSLLSGVRARLGEELALLAVGLDRTEQRAKAHSPWDLALKRRAELAVRLADATRARDQSEQRRAELAQVTIGLDAIGSREVLAVHVQGIAEAQQRLDTANASRNLFEAAQRSAEDAERVRIGIARALEGLQGDIAEVERLESVRAEVGPRVEALTAELARERAAAAACEATVLQLRVELARADALVLARERRAVHLAKRGRLDELVATLARGQGLAGEIERLTTRLAVGAINDVDLERVLAAEAALVRANDALAAGAPRIDIAYVPGAEGAIRVDGVGARGGVQAVSDGPVVLEIAGLGTITVSAGAGANRAQLLEDRERARADLATRLSQLAADDVAAVRMRHEETRTQQGQLDSVRAQLRGLSPWGLERLTGEIETARAELLATAIDEAPADEEAVIAGTVLRQAELRQEEAQGKALATQILSLTGEISRELADGQHRAALLREIAGRLPPRDQWPVDRRRLAARLDEVSQVASTALRTAAALREGLVSAADCAHLERDVVRLRGEEAARVREIGQLQVKRGQLVGALDSADEQGLASQVQVLEGEMERACREVVRQQSRVEALVLLDSELEAIERDNQERFLAPVSAHVAPFMELMFPMFGSGAARLGFDRELSVRRLQRGLGSDEPLGRLSGGTQEQIAVLVRLGFGQLLAQAGQAAPLILDDALVYCDDERIVRVFRALELASRNHQVIVLSCRERSFAQLGGNRVHITAWEA